MANNVILIMTDELRRDTLGCYGNPIVKTPSIDKLAQTGYRFSNAYTPSPICVPARASIATGLYVHENRCWTNAMPYSGQSRSWHHELRDIGRDVVSIGKLHFKSRGTPNGFSEEIVPVHVKDGKGWIHGLLRERTDLFDASGFAENIGPGTDPYSDYDRKVCELAQEWLVEKSKTSPEGGWCLFLSFLRPHYPLTCPPEFYEMYNPKDLPQPCQESIPPELTHPVLKNLQKACDYDASFTKETRQVAIASYYGLCSFVDSLVGKITKTLSDTSLEKTTNVIFTSDHGECLGDRGFWTKMVMYEEASAVPLIMSGPDISQGVNKAPVSLIDLYATVLELVSVRMPKKFPKHSKSLIESIKEPIFSRPIISEFHDYGAQTGMFMLRYENWKLIVYPGFRSQLFNLREDPGEKHDYALGSMHLETIECLTKILCSVLDPKKVNLQAFQDQEEKIAELGGRESILSTQNFDHTPVKIK